MKDKKMHKTSVGGQALIEGVMMQGPRGIATAVRKTDGDIVVKITNLIIYVINTNLGIAGNQRYGQFCGINDFGL